MNLKTIFLLMGGLGMFLFGMQIMSDGLQKAAGAKMRGILEFFTQNRFIGMVVGIIFTAIIQSSNATTVMVVSFVNSGLMNLYQASGVILGANIGTTVTGQLIAFNLSDIAPLFIMIGVVMSMFFKRDSVKRIGVVVLGFGILFMGLSTMGTALTAVKESQVILGFLATLANPFLALFVGFVITSVLQSSSATVGIIILMASQDLLEFAICPFLILGCNIGACMSAMLASLSGNKEAKRAAWIHFLFNVIGTAVIFILLMAARGPIIGALMAMSGNSAARAVANAHTLIKVIEVIMLFPFMEWIVKATYKIIPGTDTPEEEEFELLYIGRRNMLTPSTATVDAIHEIVHMGKVASENIRLGMKTLCHPDAGDIAEILQKERYINFMNHRITDFLVRASSMEMPVADVEIIGGLFHVVNDIERIGDHAENMAEAAQRILEDGIKLSDKAVVQLQDMTEMVLRILDYSLDMFSNKNQEHMQEVLDLEDAIDAREKKLQRSHVKRLTKGKCSPDAGMIFSDTVSGLERVADHATNIAFAILQPEGMDDEDD
ncbi:MAG: Na/Pi cotransporter family protein [Coprococcus sp.]|nr:Na/Pi cotransporter family protein [Coprococcus sp.]